MELTSINSYTDLINKALDDSDECSKGSMHGKEDIIQMHRVQSTRVSREIFILQKQSHHLLIVGNIRRT